MPERTIHNIEAERVIIGNLINGSIKMNMLLAALDIADFFDEKHRAILQAIDRIFSRGEGISTTTIFRSLKKEHREDIQLSDLVDFTEGIPISAEIEGFIRSVRAKSIQRKVILSCKAIIDKTLLDEDASETIESGTRVLTGLGSALQTESDLHTPIEVIEEAGGIENYIRSQSISGIQSPWREFNTITHGLREGELILIAGGTGRGKTSLALNLAHHAAKSGIGTAVYSMEMSKEEITNRLIGIAGKLDTRKIRRPTGDDAAEIMRTIGSMYDEPIWTCDRTGSSVASIDGSIRRMRAKKPVGLAVVDNINLLAPTGKSDNRTQEISKMSRGLKLLAAELKIPIIALCHLNRAAVRDKNRRPELHDLRDGGSLEQDANMVLFLHSEAGYEKTDPTTVVELIVAKQRSGPFPAIIDLWFQKATGVFSEIEKMEENGTQPPAKSKRGKPVKGKKEQEKHEEPEPTAEPEDPNVLAFG